ncbi:geranylgeranylglyceryl/heptaprenylglyceryl phosphate synthase [Christiangramia sp. SM2212]|uniref:Geranylgeranylglyceryl phosphate synthase n=1 Tax=Christiangramia sediminicola TaxID=3073267 RepID=A0ABU1ET65_9FLAO|nr:geranylgeranylglyceryl/heptaprenylglyceryl phosphate synthase [Christiangramia sp. SM2212]MDR5591586.1 geranylgeranylglyceryl/heptaprenylglyceryl phosphate synthase [Christiangramia sp. SM2212]
MIEVQSYLEEIQQAAYESRKMLAVLIDPDKFDESEASKFVGKLPEETTHIFVGGSTVEKGRTCEVVKALKNRTGLPIILFPGDHSQISSHADALLFLSLISGRNPEFLIEQQVRSVEKIRNTNLEIIPTGYILIDGGRETSVQKESNTLPLAQNNIQQIVNTALAGQYSGKKIIYLEAGSGAKNPVSAEIIQEVKNALDIPIIVGGGIRSTQQLQLAYEAGADLVVIGTAFENGSFQQ